MTIEYSDKRTISAADFVGVLRRSTLAERRPVDDAEVIDSMLRHANLIWGAWSDGLLVGVARSVTDFSCCCYMSDLAVDVAFQRQGIGRELIRLTQLRLGPKCQLILLAAPKAEDYYPKLGFTRHKSAWLISARGPLS